jgi:hypothetical protein
VDDCNAALGCTHTPVPGCSPDAGMDAGRPPPPPREDAGRDAARDAADSTSSEDAPTRSKPSGSGAAPTREAGDDDAAVPAPGATGGSVAPGDGGNAAWLACGVAMLAIGQRRRRRVTAPGGSGNRG